MIENHPQNVASALDILLEEVEAEIDFINSVGARSFERRDYDQAREALEHSASLTTYRDKVTDLRKEWGLLSAKTRPHEDEQTRSERRNLGRLRRGLRTQEEAYYEPILRAIVEMGGSGQMSDVLHRVGRAMKSVLKEVDFQPLAGTPDALRWRNTAQWARNTLVKDGLLKADSPRGLWEISEAGRQWLNKT
ncbi:MAG TPA: winged helix-turn-helix domain-containing protein [Clostridia bacterium]|nr:winged helix-turn-helix domain-containing protein [Clostridia bacterium]